MNSHHPHTTMKVKFALPRKLRQKCKEEYQRLTSDKLLSACLLGKTQNQNKHLHSRVWRYCSKYKSANKTILDLATAKAVIDYNAGYQEGNFQTLLGLPCTNIGKSAQKTKDKKRESVCSQRERKMNTHQLVDFN
ncbi:hypothetical protein Pcinc_004401 [Petrolisthes cinctipes]|uniref:Uncharacterized protein n=1 Tax=Petrolisthes cinctipes TaxID=88211 RepID=A0AAE1L143_PETCI|nr:hypothetical protein Pcinc_004401 [Petrolisthes cinctipes]